MLCINGHALSADQKFCGICGSPAGPNPTQTEVNQPPAVQPVTPPQTCPHGVIITAGSNPCVYCSNPAPDLNTPLQRVSQPNFETPVFQTTKDGSRKKIIAIASAFALIAALVLGINVIRTMNAPDYSSLTLSGLYKGDTTKINNLLGDACIKIGSNLTDLVSSMDDTQSSINSNYTTGLDISTNFVDEYDTLTKAAANQALKAALSQDYSKLGSASELVADIVSQMETGCNSDPSLSDVSTQAAGLDSKIDDIKTQEPTGYHPDTPKTTRILIMPGSGARTQAPIT